MKKRVWGVLAGVALGDSMGMPTECYTQERIQEEYPNGIQTLYPSNEKDVFARKLGKGAITDDTINTLMILDMIKHNDGKITVEDYIKELQYWNKNSGVSAYVSGPSTLKALEKIEQGVPLEKTGVTGTTNGAAMKIAPIGLISDYHNMKQLVENVYQICLPTHNTKIAIAGASAVAAAISYVVQGGSDIQTLWDIAYEAIEVSKEYGYDFPSASLSFRMKQAQRILQEEVDEKQILKRLYNEIGSGMETIETIPCVFAIVEMAHNDPLKAASLSAMIGWDTDTIGAISCSICGGMQPDLPLSLIKTIEELNYIDFEQLTNEIFPYVVKVSA